MGREEWAFGPWVIHVKEMSGYGGWHSMRIGEVMVVRGSRWVSHESSGYGRGRELET